MKNILMNTEMTKAILDGRKTQTRRVVNCNNYNEVILDELASQCGYASENYGCKHKDSGDVDEDGNGRCFTWSCPLAICGYEDEETSEDYSSFDGDNYVYIPKPKYQKGDIVWVREPARVSSINNNCNGKLVFEYLADDGLKPTCARYTVNLYSIDMPNRFLDKNGAVNRKWINLQQGIPNGCIKEMARIFLKITDVRVERLQDITLKDIRNEGIKQNFLTKEETIKAGCQVNTLGIDFVKLWNKTASKGYKWEDNPYVFVYEFERVNRDGSRLC